MDDPHDSISSVVKEGDRLSDLGRWVFTQENNPVTISIKEPEKVKDTKEKHDE